MAATTGPPVVKYSLQDLSANGERSLAFWDYQDTPLTLQVPTVELKYNYASPGCNVTKAFMVLSAIIELLTGGYHVYLTRVAPSTVYMQLQHLHWKNMGCLQEGKLYLSKANLQISQPLQEDLINHTYFDEIVKGLSPSPDEEATLRRFYVSAMKGLHATERFRVIIRVGGQDLTADVHKFIIQAALAQMANFAMKCPGAFKYEAVIKVSCACEFAVRALLQPLPTAFSDGIENYEAIASIIHNWRFWSVTSCHAPHIITASHLPGSPTFVYPDSRLKLMMDVETRSRHAFADTPEDEGAQS